ncbi:MAG: AIPR family protein [Hyphomicrobiaceae bacterium]|nr:AIPR family protein [Hyphomicrobiaceae bacterium]
MRDVVLTLRNVQLSDISTRTARAFLGTVDAGSLVAFATEEAPAGLRIRHVLFQDNVRGDLRSEKYIDNAGARGIATTLRSGFRHDLALLHNGITVTASACQPGEPDGVVLHHPQIVNGCQTIHTLVRNFGALDGCRVVIKIVVTSDERLKDRIVAAANTQESLDYYDMLSRNARVRDLIAYFASPAYPDPRTIWFQARRGARLSGPDEMRGEPDWSRIVRPRHLMEAYIAAVEGQPHAARTTFMRKAASVFAETHEAALYAALAWTVVVGRLWALRTGKKWQDRFVRSSADAFPARLHFLFAVWRLCEAKPQDVEPADLRSCEANRLRFLRLRDRLQADAEPIGDLAWKTLQVAASRLGKHIDSGLAGRAVYTASIAAAAAEVRAAEARAIFD